MAGFLDRDASVNSAEERVAPAIVAKEEQNIALEAPLLGLQIERLQRAGVGGGGDHQRRASASSIFRSSISRSVWSMSLFLYSSVH
jgi:hypothetical protein